MEEAWIRSLQTNKTTFEVRQSNASWNLVFSCFYERMKEISINFNICIHSLSLRLWIKRRHMYASIIKDVWTMDLAENCILHNYFFNFVFQVRFIRIWSEGWPNPCSINYSLFWKTFDKRTRSKTFLKQFKNLQSNHFIISKNIFRYFDTLFCLSQFIYPRILAYT